MKRSTVRLLLLLVLLVFVVPIAAFAAEDNETPPEGNNSTPAAVETTPAPASAPAPASGTGSTEGPAPSQQPAATNEPTPAETPATPTGTTPGETPATPTGTTPGETPATPTGTTPGETPATPTGTTPGEPPATTDGTPPEDKTDDAEEDEENPEPAEEKADVEKAKLASVKKNGAMLGALQALPGDNVTNQLEMVPGDSKSGNFEIGNGGYVFGPKSGFATISNGTVINNARNDKKGGVSDSKGSAFLSRTGGTLKFYNVTINSDDNTIPLNIWENATIDAEKLTLNGPKNGSENTVFMLIGNYGKAGAGTLNLDGDNTFSEIKGTISGATSGSVINVNSGTLTVKDSTIKMANNIAFIVKEGATLALENSTLYNSKVVVESGGKLIVNNNSILDTKDAFNDYYINVESGGTLEMKDSKVKNHSGSHVAILAENNATVDLTNCEFLNNSHPNLPGGAIRGINANITVKGCWFENNTAKWGGAIHMSGGTLTIDDSSTFIRNRAMGYQDKEKSATAGGAIMLTGGANATIGESKFEKNGVPKDEDGNPKYVDSDSVTMRGGAIYIDAGSVVELKGTTFENNGVFYLADSYASPTSTGGAICIEGEKAILNIKGAQFKNNYSGTTGGALSAMLGAEVNIDELKGTPPTPTRFVNNQVIRGYDFAGGAIFINRDSKLTMTDAAIFNNEADGAGGGISTCGVGAAEVHSLEGAAIFDNTVTERTYQNGDAQNLKDVYFWNIDSQKDVFPVELSERIFSGGIHNWSVKIFNDATENYTALIAKSDPAYDYKRAAMSNAKVIFTGNSAKAAPSSDPENPYIVSGGAIGCNGQLEIGTADRTEIKIVKIWKDDTEHASRARPTTDALLSKIHLLKNEEKTGSTIADLKLEGAVEVTVLTGADAKAVNPYSDLVDRGPRGFVFVRNGWPCDHQHPH